jgi:hypothetical protein
VILLRDDLLNINQRGKLRFGRADPGSGVFGATGVLRNRDNFKIFVLQFLVEGLPTWQVETAASPGGPGDEQDFLATKITE